MQLRLQVGAGVLYASGNLRHDAETRVTDRTDFGSDQWRYLGGAVCDNIAVRQDLLDELVWREMINLLDNPNLIQEELDRRLSAARDANPTKQREESLRRELARIQKSIDRLMTAYQDDCCR